MTTRSWIRKLFARQPPTIRKAPADYRPRLEPLEDRLAPAVQLLYNESGSALQLTELNGAAGTTHVTLYEDGAGNLDISLNGGTFAASSSPANGFTYLNGAAVFNASSADVFSILKADLGGDALPLGAINQTANVVDNLVVSVRTIDLGAEINSRPNVISTTAAPAGPDNNSLTATQSIYLAPNAGSVITTKDGSITLQTNQDATPAGGDFSGINIDGALVASSGAGVTLIQGRGGNDPSLPV
jgi:hypothetical protein